MPGWRYLATRLNGDGTETFLDPDVPLEGVEIQEVLSGHSVISGTIDPVYTRLLGPDGTPILREWSTALYAEKDGEIRAGGILNNGTEEGSEWQFEFVGFTGYYIDMPYTGDGYKGIRVDPMNVARVIWDHPQEYEGGNIGLEYDDTLSGLSIGTELTQVEFDTQEGPVSFEAGPYKLNWYSNHDLAGDIDALATETPFDYVEKHYWDGENIRHHVHLGYPAIGRRREDLRFVFGVNIFEPPTVARLGELFASGTLVLGSGEGPAMIHDLREIAPARSGRLRRIAVVTDESIKTKESAGIRANAETQWRSKIDDIGSITVVDHKNAALGAAGLGDEIYIEGRGDWRTYGMWVRILAITYSPEEGGVAEYSVARSDKLTS